jgi:hypothetical protein
VFPLKYLLNFKDMWLMDLDAPDTRTTEPTAGVGQNLDPINALSPISSNAMNSLNSASAPSQDSPQSSKTPNGTIRSVPSESLHLETSVPSDEDTRRVQSKSDSAAISNSTKAYGALPTSQPPLTWQNNIPVSNGLVRTISSEFGPTKNFSNSNLHAMEDNSASSSNGVTSPGAPQWSSAVGRANLGKSGRVIERLMGENDMLKRDLNIERLRAEESKQSVKMAEGKMEAMASEYEGKLHDAAINKTLLKRRERQLAEVKAQVDGERQRADKAVEREKGWRDAMEKEEAESKRKVEEAQTYAALMEGRNKAMTSHWKEQGAEVNRTVNKLGKEIEALVIERRNDDDRMNMLQGLCDQQAEQLTALQKEKEGIYLAFENYKKEQEDGLRAIKERARLQEEKNEEILMESQRVLGELKWALGVKKNVKDAE